MIWNGVVQIQFNNITGENDCKPQYFWVYLLIHLSPVRKPSVGVADLPAAMSDSLEPWRSVKRCWRLWFACDMFYISMGQNGWPMLTPLMTDGLRPKMATFVGWFILHFWPIPIRPQIPNKANKGAGSLCDIPEKAESMLLCRSLKLLSNLTRYTWSSGPARALWTMEPSWWVYVQTTRFPGRPVSWKAQGS